MTQSLESLDGFLSRPLGLVIDGTEQAAARGGSFPVVNPATAQTLTTVADGTDADVDLAVASARVAFESWSSRAPSERAELLWRLGSRVEELAGEFARLEALDNGKPVSESLAVDLPLFVALMKYYAGWATKIEGETIPTASGAPFHVYTRREPLGVIAAIIPWNFPLLMCGYKLGPALAAGNTVVLKPAEQTPLSALRLMQVMGEVGFPPGVVNLVTGFGPTAGAPLVFADADLDAAVEGTFGAVFFNQGQCCVAGARVYVQDEVYDDFVARLTDRATQVKLGSGLDPQTTMGPLVSAEQRDRVLSLIDSGLAEGARPASGIGRTEEPGLRDGFFVSPVILTDVAQDMRVMREEIFGPVALVSRFSTEAEAIQAANDTNFGLASGIWTRDIKRGHRVAAAIRAGVVWVNNYGWFDAAVPYGGFRLSGFGKELGREALDAYLQTKTVWVDLSL